MGTSTREANYVALETPGPGAYKQEGTESRGPRWGYHYYSIPFLISSNRFGTEKETFVATTAAPGPGAYNTKSEIGIAGQGPTMAPRRIEKSVEKVPGPGSYDHSPKDRKQGPSFTFTGRSKEVELDKVPGPGSYSPGREVIDFDRRL